jgi:hypothetical protein
VAVLRKAFQGLLNLALTRGRAASDDYPDAEADDIAAAYDAFDREHRDD